MLSRGHGTFWLRSVRPMAAAIHVSPDFNYISREQLRSTMWRLARDMRELEQTLREPGEFDEQRRAQINRLLISRGKRRTPGQERAEIQSSGN